MWGEITMTHTHTHDVYENRSLILLDCAVSDFVLERLTENEHVDVRVPRTHRESLVVSHLGIHASPGLLTLVTPMT